MKMYLKAAVWLALSFAADVGAFSVPSLPNKRVVAQSGIRSPLEQTYRSSVSLRESMDDNNEESKDIEDAMKKASDALESSKDEEAAPEIMPIFNPPSIFDPPDDSGE